MRKCLNSKSSIELLLNETIKLKLIEIIDIFIRTRTLKKSVIKWMYEKPEWLIVTVIFKNELFTRKIN